MSSLPTQSEARLFEFVKPMKAKAKKKYKSAFRLANDFGTGVGQKMDGHRLELHYKRNGPMPRLKLFTRNGAKFKKSLVPALCEHIDELFAVSVESLIIDAEVVVVDTTNGEHQSNGWVLKENKPENCVLCVFAFDFLYENGRSFLNAAWIERRKMLEEAVVTKKNVLQLTPLTYITCVEELKREMEKAVINGWEGLVLKSKMGVYEPGKRKWVKLKRAYMCETVVSADSVDLIVLGASYGASGEVLSSFLLGCFDEENECFVTVCAVGNLTQKLKVFYTGVFVHEKKMKAVDKSELPPYLRITKVPDFVICNPKASAVWQLKVNAFEKYDKYTAPINIRNATFQCVRTDKGSKEATTLKELLEIAGDWTKLKNPPMDAEMYTTASSGMLATTSLLSTDMQPTASLASSGTLPTTSVASSGMQSMAHDFEEYRGRVDAAIISMKPYATEGMIPFSFLAINCNAKSEEQKLNLSDTLTEMEEEGAILWDPNNDRIFTEFAYAQTEYDFIEETLHGEVLSFKQLQRCDDGIHVGTLYAVLCELEINGIINWDRDTDIIKGEAVPRSSRPRKRRRSTENVFENC